MTASIKITVFWVVTPCDLVSVKFMESELVVLLYFCNAQPLVSINYAELPCETGQSDRPLRIEQTGPLL